MPHLRTFQSHALTSTIARTSMGVQHDMLVGRLGREPTSSLVQESDEAQAEAEAGRPFRSDITDGDGEIGSVAWLEPSRRKADMGPQVLLWRALVIFSLRTFAHNTKRTCIHSWTTCGGHHTTGPQLLDAITQMELRSAPLHATQYWSGCRSGQCQWHTQAVSRASAFQLGRPACASRTPRAHVECCQLS